LIRERSVGSCFGVAGTIAIHQAADHMKTKILLFSLLSSLAVCGSLQGVVLAYDRINVTNIPGQTVSAVPNDANYDTGPITAAVNYAFPTPTPGYTPTKSIYFPAGTYQFDGSLTLPSNTSIRLYGDGPGVTTIIFTGSNPGITGNLGTHTLQIEGLTLQCNAQNVGTAISATFNTVPRDKSATIRNVQIRGSDLTNTPSGYWRYGIDLEGASNAVIDDVQIHGAYTLQTPYPDDAIHWHGPADPNFAAVELYIHNLSVFYYKTALRTSGWVEGLYMSGFELVFCGSDSTGAMEITGQTSKGFAVPAFHFVNGHINQLVNGIKMSHVVSVKISHVNFLNQIGYGNHIALTDVSGATIIENDFTDYDCGPPPPPPLPPNCTPIVHGNGIYLFPNTHGTRICGNRFSLNNEVDGSAVVVREGCTKTAILDNDFGDSAHTINNIAGKETAIRDIPFP
jgi:hypothetical protein